MKVLDQHTFGDFFDSDGDYNYETGEMFAATLFDFTN